MFRSKSFNISLLISLTWHLFWVFAIVIVILPKGFGFARFPTISFLGPILEEGIFSGDLMEARTSVPTPYRKNLLPEKGLPASRVNSQHGQNAGELNSKKVLLPNNLPFVHTKKVPLFHNTMSELADNKLKGSNVKAVLSRQGIWIESPLSDRKIIYIPQAPRLPKWTRSTTDAHFFLKLKVFVSASGNIEHLEQLTSTGHPELDLLGMRYVRGFIFQELPDANNSSAREGTITVRLK